jgi:hypothetical protein
LPSRQGARWRYNGARDHAVEEVLKLSQGFKICPICGTHAHRNATLCSTCGASLADVPVVSETSKPSASTPAGQAQYDQRYGETDLLESGQRSRGETMLFSALIGIVALACVGGLIFTAVRWILPAVGASPQPTPTAETVATQPAILIETNTPMPPPVLATVTPPPPTASNTPTPGPCTHVVAAGEDLIGIAMGCGHRSMDVIPLILQMNNLTSAGMIQVGQELMIPWPTPTTDPNAAPVPTTDPAATQTGEEGGDSTASGAAALEIASLPTSGPPTARPTATLLPGVMWYVVQPNENIVSVAFENFTDVQTLSQLNPEITFSQCDFGNPAGGPECNVIIYAGQQIRVPAPTPTPTLSPTLSGSETATPTLTPTFNAPSALSPADRILFRNGELITLRWVGSGTLGEGETYRVRVEDLTSGQTYTADTTDLSYILPSDWQGKDGQRHDYSWTISVINLANPDRPYFTTEPRLFTWEGR